MGYFFSFPQVLKIQKRTASWAGLYLCCILNYYWPDRQNEQHPTAAGETAHTFIAESVLALCLGCFARPKLRVLFLHTFSNCFLIVVVLSIRSVNKETSLTQLNSVEFCLAKQKQFTNPLAPRTRAGFENFGQQSDQTAFTGTDLRHRKQLDYSPVHPLVSWLQLNWLVVHNLIS